MTFKINIVHDKYYTTKAIKVVSYELVETDGTAAYDYDRGTSWKAIGGDWISTYRMAAYLETIESRKIFKALDENSRLKLVNQLAAEWHTYADYYTMKLTLTRNNNIVYYDLSKSGIVGSGHCKGFMQLTFQ